MMSLTDVTEGDESRLPQWNDSAINKSELDDGSIDVQLYEWLFVPILFGLIFVVGVVGNGTLIYTVVMNKTMRSTPNILIVSLAVGDLFLILFTVPFMSTTYTFEQWPYGEGLCKLGEFSVALSLGVTVFTLTALSAERYIVIVHPMSAVNRGGGRLSAPVRTFLIASAIWVLSAGLGSIELVAAHLTDGVVDGAGVTVCHSYPDGWGEEYAKFHVVFRFVVYFAVPITIIAVFYILMARMLVVSAVHVPGDGVKGQAMKQLEARKKVARLILSFVVVFIVCWLPRHVWYFWFSFDPAPYNMFWHVFKIVAFCLSYVNSCVNPLALYFLSRQFRRYYDRYLCCCCAFVGLGSDASSGSAGVGLTDVAAGGAGAIGLNAMRGRGARKPGSGVDGSARGVGLGRGTAGGEAATQPGVEASHLTRLNSGLTTTAVLQSSMNDSFREKRCTFKKLNS